MLVRSLLLPAGETLRTEPFVLTGQVEYLAEGSLEAEKLVAGFSVEGFDVIEMWVGSEPHCWNNLL